MAGWIGIRIRNADPDQDPGGLKRAKKEGKKQAKGRYLGITRIKSNVIGIKRGKCYRYRYFIFIMLTFNLSFKKLSFLMLSGSDPHSFLKLDPDSLKKLDPDPHKVHADPKHCTE
jgi:hypothetical protein